MNTSVPTKNLLLIAFLSFNISTPTQAKINNAPLSFTIAAGAIILYSANWALSKFIYYRANSRYDLPIAVVTAFADNPNDHASLYQELLGLVNVDNATYTSPSSRYYHYPLVSFVEDLDWYIRKLSIASWLTIPTALSHNANQLKKQLQRVRYYCVRHSAYSEQRRKADQAASCLPEIKQQ